MELDGACRAATALLVVGLAAGCAGTSAGTPRAEPPDSTTPTSEQSATTATTTSGFPPPPREIPLDDVNPCQLWTTDQLRSFGINDGPVEGDPSPNGFGGTSCFYFGPREAKPRVVYSAHTYPRSGLAEAERYRGPGTVSARVEVARFPAFQQQSSEGDSACDVIIGPAAGQHLTVSVTVTPNELSMDEFCALSMTAAIMAVENLQAQR